MNDDWRPTASSDALRRRAAALAATRAFFAARGVLEVETPALVNAPVSDINIESARVTVDGLPGVRYLHTSPEYAMKRLLAAGAGDIYQICRVFRGGERGRMHNPEFTMVEWYRLGFSLEALMHEVAALLRELSGGSPPTELISYRDAVRDAVGVDPLEAPDADIRRAACALGLDETQAARGSRDDLLDFIIATRVGPSLGHDRLTFLHRYPASQAALARLDAADARVALRFELYHQGVELANGYHELANSAQLAQRFAADQKLRGERSRAVNPLDRRLLAALDAGLPDCVGVALGFDRVLMLALGARSIEEVLSFPVETA